MKPFVRATALAFFGTMVQGPSSTAHAAGTLVKGDGSFVGGPVVDASVASVRAVLFQQDDAVTAVFQAATSYGETIGSAWILPIHGTILTPPQAADPAIINELLRASDPIFEMPTISGCGPSTGCGLTDSGDSGGTAITDIGTFDTTQAGATWAYYGPTAVDSATESLRESGYTLSDDLAETLQTHGAAGGSVVVMFFTEDRDESATPALVVRYAASELTLPQAVTAFSEASRVQTSVLTLSSEGAYGPRDVPHTTPRLGLPLYQPDWAADFYAGRVLRALDQAGPTAWLLEYSNTLESLTTRGAELDDDSVLWSSSDVPWGGLNTLETEGLLAGFDPALVWLTRWRTVQEPDILTDQVFVPDPSVPTYEVYVEAESFSATGSTWPAPVFLGLWVLGRRRRHVHSSHKT